MKPIVTLTLNPSIDGASEADRVRHTNKIRTSNERYDPGGGGINVARVVRELGGDSLALYLAGGATGSVLDTLLDRHAIPRLAIPIRDHTRISHVVYERESGREFRFVPEGPGLSSAEVAAALAAVEECDFDYLVASGSLPRGAPEDFYVRIARIAARKGAKCVLDTSGPALAAALGKGAGGAELGNIARIHLVKPSAGEFEAFVGRSLTSVEAIAEAGQALIASGRVDLLAVTLGHEGAVLIDAQGWLHRGVPDVPVRSAVGAGDSFVAGMTYALARGRPAREAFIWGMAAGTAAVLTPGTEMCRREDVERIFAQMSAPANPA